MNRYKNIFGNIYEGYRDFEFEDVIINNHDEKRTFSFHGKLITQSYRFDPGHEWDDFPSKDIYHHVYKIKNEDKFVFLKREIGYVIYKEIISINRTHDNYDEIITDFFGYSERDKEIYESLSINHSGLIGTEEDNDEAIEKGYEHQSFKPRNGRNIHFNAEFIFKHKKPESTFETETHTYLYRRNINNRDQYILVTYKGKMRSKDFYEYHTIYAKVLYENGIKKHLEILAEKQQKTKDEASIILDELFNIAGGRFW